MASEICMRAQMLRLGPLEHEEAIGEMDVLRTEVEYLSRTKNAKSLPCSPAPKPFRQSSPKRANTGLHPPK